MRIRSTKPEFWRSRRVASVSWDARLVLKGLESYVDDNGVGKDDIAMIVGDIFARDMFANSRETVARVSEAISEAADAGLVWRYEVDGTELLYISFWESIQRIDKPGKGRFPRPDGTFEYGASQIRESLARSSETLAPGTEEQGNRGTGEQGIADAGASSGAATRAELAIVEDRPDVDHLCNLLADRIEDNGSNRPTITKGWRDAARLLLDKDARTVEQIVGAIEWCQADEFWRGNVLSMPKLREKYDQLRLQASRRPIGVRAAGGIDWDAAFERARQLDAEREAAR